MLFFCWEADVRNREHTLDFKEIGLSGTTFEINEQLCSNYGLIITQIRFSFIKSIMLCTFNLLGIFICIFLIFMYRSFIKKC